MPTCPCHRHSMRPGHSASGRDGAGVSSAAGSRPEAPGSIRPVRRAVRPDRRAVPGVCRPRREAWRSTPAPWRRSRSERLFANHPYPLGITSRLRRESPIGESHRKNRDGGRRETYRNNETRIRSTRTRQVAPCTQNQSVDGNIYGSGFVALLSTRKIYKRNKSKF